MHCINCNGTDVTRTGDDFHCKSCGYDWDVAHEQANAAYLRSQGRVPAKPMAVVEKQAALDEQIAALQRQQRRIEAAATGRWEVLEDDDLLVMADEQGVEVPEGTSRETLIGLLTALEAGEWQDAPEPAAENDEGDADIASTPLIINAETEFDDESDESVELADNEWADDAEATPLGEFDALEELNIADLRLIAERHGIDLSGLRLKSDIVAAIHATLEDEGE